MSVNPGASDPGASLGTAGNLGGGAPATAPTTAPPQTTDPGAGGLPTTPPPTTATPADPFADYGGADRVARMREFYDSFYGSEFNPDAMLDRLVEADRDRYLALANNIFQTHGDQFRQNTVREFLASEEGKRQAIEALGWNDADYRAYQQFLQTDAYKQMIDPERYEMRQRLDALDRERKEQELSVERAQNMQAFETFQQKLAEPINNFVSQIQFPRDPQGNLTPEAQVALQLMLVAPQGVFAQDPKAMADMDAARKAFESGAHERGADKYMQLRAHIERHAKPVIQQIARWMQDSAELQRLRAESGDRRIEPGVATPAQSGAGALGHQQGNQPGLPALPGIPGYGPFSADAIKAERDAILAQRRQQR